MAGSDQVTLVLVAEDFYFTEHLTDTELGSWPQLTNCHIKKKTGLELERHMLKHEVQTVDILWEKNGLIHWNLHLFYEET